MYKEVYKREHAVKHDEYMREFGDDFWTDGAVRTEILEGVKAEVSTRRLADVTSRTSSKNSDRRNRLNRLGAASEDSQASERESQNAEASEQQADMDLDMDI